MYVWLKNSPVSLGRLCFSREHFWGKEHMEEKRKKVISACCEMAIAMEGIADCIVEFGLSRVEPQL